MGESAHTKGPWEDAAERICLAMVKRAPDHLRRASEALYSQMLYDVQDYLRENVEFNLSSELTTAKNRARDAEAQAARLKTVAESHDGALRLLRRAIVEGGPKDELLFRVTDMLNEIVDALSTPHPGASPMKAEADRAESLVDVAEWRAAMEGVTPGPWRPSRFGFQVVSDYPEPAGQSVVDLTTIARSEPNVEREMLTQIAIAKWIARCSPSGISALLDAIDRLTKENAAQAVELAEARAALEPFARRAYSAESLHDDLSPAWAPAFRIGDFRRAKSVLENGPSGLADATQKGTEKTEAGR